jgi:hypothetical protein
MVAGKTVSIAMPGGAVVTGKAARVEPDALVVNVAKTTDPNLYPKGELRVPRARLHILHMQTKGKLFRTLGTAFGAGAGITGGTIAAVAIDWHDNHGTAAGFAFAGIAAAGTAAGYLAGNRWDMRWTTIEILPDVNR